MTTTLITALLAYAVWTFKMNRTKALAPVRIRRK